MIKNVAILILVSLSVILIGCSTDPIQEMRSQLEELDSTSYSAIRDWIESDFPMFKEEHGRQLEGFEVNVRAYDTKGTLIHEGFLENEARFIEWSFYLDEDKLDIDVTYVSYGDYISKQLQVIDRNSLLDIMEWIEDYNGSMDIEIDTIDVEGNSHQYLNPLEAEGFFVEWNYSIHETPGSIILKIEVVFQLNATIELGESIVFQGLLFTFFDEVIGARVDDFYSAIDGSAYLEVKVAVKNITDEYKDFFHFNIYYLEPGGGRHIDFGWARRDSISRMMHLDPGEVHEGYIRFLFRGEGEYTIEIEARDEDIPFKLKVIVPVYDIDFPDRVEREEREVEIPEVVFDLEVDEINLFGHDLPVDSFFYSIPYVSELGNTYMILEPNEVVRNPVGVITHDSLRVSYTIFENTSEGGFEGAVDRMEWLSNDVQQGGRPLIIVGNIRATEDGNTAFMHTRSGAEGDIYTRLIVIQMLGDGSEFLFFETGLWAIHDRSLEGERRSAIEEFGRLTGIDFIEILRRTYEGQ